jgi:hypothetical protein
MSSSSLGANDGDHLKLFLANMEAILFFPTFHQPNRRTKKTNTRHVLSGIQSRRLPPIAY